MLFVKVKLIIRNDWDGVLLILGCGDKINEREIKGGLCVFLGKMFIGLF